MSILKNLKQQIEDSNYVSKPIEVDLSTSAKVRWDNKEVFDSKVLFDPLVDKLVKPEKAVGEFQLCDFTNPITNKKSVYLTGDASLVKGLYPPLFNCYLKLDDLDLTEYNRISMYVYVKATGFRNIFWNICLGDDVKSFIKHDYPHDPSVEVNKWEKISWELGHISRKNLKRLTISPFIGGQVPEGLNEVTFYISEIVCEKVIPDYEEGWDLEERIAYSHAGYFTKSNKVALAQNIKSKTFVLKNEQDQVVFTNNVKEVNNFNVLDFTEFENEGEFYLEVDNKKTYPFVINDNPYLSSIWKSISFLKSLQCGVDVYGVHSPCHLHCHTIHPDGRKVPNFGGWHDAGDLSQFEICTAEMAHAILDLTLEISEKKLKDRLLEEAKVGLHWLLRTRFGDGYRALAILYGTYRDNVLDPSLAEKMVSKAENGPFENLLASAALAKGYQLFVDVDNNFAEWCLRAAIEDYQFGIEGYKQGLFTKRWGSNIDSVVCGTILLAAVEIYRANGDKNILNNAKKYAQTIIDCQQQEYLDWEKPLRGFFYECSDHKYVLYYEHRGHEQSPIMGLINLCMELKDDKDYPKWLNCIELYKEFVIKSLEYTKPYALVPNQLYILGKVNSERVTVPGYFGALEEGMKDLDEQIKGGIKLSEDAYLRVFPAAVQRRGYHATLLSKTKAISQMGIFLNDQSLIQISIDQLEWILGKNPFASSTMYGEGHNYHPLYVAYSNQMVGALPVGIKTYANNDLPYWPAIDNAVYKEVWGHTTGKYLWVLADILKYLK